MKTTIALAAATMLLSATGAFAQAAMAPGGTMMKSTAPKADASDMKADTSADADTAMAKPKHRASKSKSAMNASEAETTKQLNMEQSQMASGAR
ncbi:MAG: hypothetical protein V4559_02285 [Pseudomonadota bacterium]